MNEGVCEAPTHKRRPRERGQTGDDHPASYRAVLASPGSVSGEETTLRFGHPGIGLDNREY